MKIGYARVSSKDQNLDRQIKLLNQQGIERLYTEKVSATASKRPVFDEMMNFIREDDILYIESFSRLARNTQTLFEIIENLHQQKIQLVSMKENFIISDTAHGKLALTIFLALAEFERDCLHERQREGIQSAKAKGIHCGRPIIALPKNWQTVIKQWESKEITTKKAIELTGLKTGTFYNRYHEYKRQ